jgi:hypothetical protein
MDHKKNSESELPLSDKTEIEQANIRMDREFYGDTDIEHPDELTVPFINRNES